MSDVQESSALVADTSNSQTIAVGFKALLSIYQTGQASPAQIEAINTTISNLENEVASDEAKASDVEKRLETIENAMQSMSDQLLNLTASAQNMPVPKSVTDTTGGVAAAQGGSQTSETNQTNA